MYEQELEYLNKHIDWIENKEWLKFHDNIKNEIKLTPSTNSYMQVWSNILDIFIDPDVNMDLFSGLTEVPMYLFSYYKHLPNGFKVPDNIVSIDQAAFGHSNWNDTCKLPDNLVTIKNGAFIHCLELTSLVLPESVEKIGNFAFNNCRRLHNVQLPLNLKRLYGATFSNTPIKCFYVNTEDKSKVFPQGINIDAELYYANPEILSSSTGEILGNINDFAI